MRHSALLLAVTRCHMQIIYMWKQNYYLLNSIQNFSPNNTGFPVTNHTIHVIISPVCLPQQETWRARWWSSTMKSYLSQKKASQMQIFTGTAYAPFTAKQSSIQEHFVPNRVLGASPPDISPPENLLPRSVRTTLAQLRSGHCRLLNSYKARITSGISDVCPECGVAPHSVEHLFNCQSNPTQLTGQDLWDDPAAVADFLNLDNWQKEKSRRAITTTIVSWQWHSCHLSVKLLPWWFYFGVFVYGRSRNK